MGDDLSAVLAEIHNRHRDIDCAAVAYMSAGNVPRLLAAVDAVLERHQSRQLYEWAEDVHGNPRCGHDEIGDDGRHFEGDDGIWYCQDRPTVKVCRTCSDEAHADEWAAWPCATYSAVLAALTGKGDGDAAAAH